MKIRINKTVPVVVLAAMMFTGCGGSKDTSAPSEPSVPSAPVASVEDQAATGETQTYEVGCGGCIFQMEDAVGCEAAVKVDDKTYWIEGVKISAHNIGLCSGSAEADMAGEVKDGKFIATSFALTEADGGGHDHSGHGHDHGHDHSGHDH